MAKRIIECSVNDEYIDGAGVVVGAAGSHDDVVLRLTFGDSWNPLNKWATFRDAIGENPSGVPLSATDLVKGSSNAYDLIIPESALRYSGKIKLIITGYSVSGVYDEQGALVRVAETQERHTTAAYFRVLPSDVVMYDDGSVDATIAQALQSQINYTNEAIKTLGNTFATDEELSAAVEGAKGASGVVTIKTSEWSSNKNGIIFEHKFEEIGDNDVIFFAPATAVDKDNIIKCDVWVNPVPLNQTVTFSAVVRPEENISLFYFVSRGV